MNYENYIDWAMRAESMPIIERDPLPADEHAAAIREINRLRKLANINLNDIPEDEIDIIRKVMSARAEIRELRRKGLI